MASVLTLTPNPAVDVFTSTSRMMPFTKLRCAAPQYDPGGGGVNVARVVRRLGGDALAVLPVGGTSGTMLLRLLGKEGVAIAPIQTAAETRQNFTVFDEATKSQYQFILPGPDLEQGAWEACLAKATGAESSPRIVVGSGSLPGGVPEDFYGRLAAAAKSERARVIVDCSGPALKAALREGLYLIKPNLKEFQELVGEKLTTEAAWISAGRSLIKSGQVEYVALTLGAEGALLIGADLALRAEGIPIKPASVIGAGDSFVGAVAFSLASGDSITVAFRYGVAAGTAATLNVGTQLCWSDDVRRLMTHLSIRAA